MPYAAAHARIIAHDARRRLVWIEPFQEADVQAARNAPGVIPWSCKFADKVGLVVETGIKRNIDDRGIGRESYGGSSPYQGLTNDKRESRVRY
jgi:hypothetical protein